MTVTYLDAIFNNELKHPNWFDRRILTGTDLQDEQKAHVQRTRYLGQAIGSGVAYGLAVTAEANKVNITGGLAISPGGDVLVITSNTTGVSLVSNKGIAQQPTGSIFAPCGAGSTFTLNDTPSNYHILAITTAAQPSKELAPTSTLNGADDRNCIYKYTEVGVQFKLISLGGFFAPVTENSDISKNKNRNKLAMACFGVYGDNDIDDVYGQAPNPMKMPPYYGILDELRDKKILADCDVPLAALYFKNNQVEFVDMWSVRRPVFPAQRHDAYPTAFGDWPESFTQFSNPRRMIEGSAALLQFQEHLEDLRKRSTQSTIAIHARDAFLFLPAAGYLPVGNNRVGFNVDSFFDGLDYKIQPAKLDAAYLRQIFHDSFYIDPIKVGTDEIDIYEVEDATSTTYRIFLRRLQTPVIEIPETKPEAPTTNVVNGSLRISVVDEKGLSVDNKFISEVTATDKDGNVFKAKPSTTSTLPAYKYELEYFERAFLAEATQIRTKYAPVVSALPQAELQLALREPLYYLSNGWFINSLPPGQYTVRAKPTSALKYGVSKSVIIPNGGATSITVTIRDNFRIFPPIEEYIPPERIPLPDGLIPDRWLFDPRWGDLLGRDDPGWIDPNPDDWWILDDPRAGIGIETWLGKETTLDPRIITDGAEIWVKKGINPNDVTDSVNSVIRTKDGTTLPLVMIAADNALDKSTPATRSPLPDFDAGTYTRLHEYGLGNLDALASAPAPLVTAVLGQKNLNYANNLLGATRTTLKEDFQDGFMGYAGIDKVTSDALKTTYTSKVLMANATGNDLANLNLPGLSGTYADRFLLEVRDSVPTSSYSLGTIVGAGSAANLNAMGIETLGSFVNAANSANTANAVANAVGTTELQGLIDNGLFAIAANEFTTATPRSLSGLTLVDAGVKDSLLAAGITEAKTLANTDLNTLVTITGASEATLAAAIDEATNFSFGFNTLLTGISGGAVTGTTATNAGFNTIGSLAIADTNTLSTGLVLEPEKTVKLQTFSNNILSGGLSGGAFNFNTGGFR